MAFDIWKTCKGYNPLHKVKKYNFVTLPEDTFIEQWIVPKGSKVKTCETRNFGWVILDANQKDVRGFEIPRRIFKY
jgi:hypothetical protein